MKKIKLVLLRLMGEQKYLFFVASSFQQLFKTGRLGKVYQDVYFLKNFIKPGDRCVDIGAHLGYYTFQLSRLVGQQGKVVAIEPVTKFNKVLERIIFLKQYRNIRLEKVALGGEGKLVEIGIPRINNEKKFGYARIRQLNADLEYVESEIVPNVAGDELLKDLDRVDFIKCDVEGAEVAVFKAMPNLLAKYKPVLLCELADRNERIKMFQLLREFDYGIYLLKNRKLLPIDLHSDMKAISHNHYFIPSIRLSVFDDLINA